ncbi:MAG: sigma-70 family RNA polymerase sigma factor [Bacteroidota bacterium]
MSSDFYTSQILPYAEIIIKICRAYTDTQEDFEDYYQEVCLQIWRTKKNFRGQSEWSTWIYRVALNVCLTLLKKRRNNPQHSSRGRADTALLNEQTETNNVDERQESVAQLYRAIRKLSEVDRAVILLYLEEKPYQEIADIMGTNANNIGVRIKRIKERLKKLLL